jgi:glycosyltransferase involved in cell wall biosynthesis
MHDPQAHSPIAQHATAPSDRDASIGVPGTARKPLRVCFVGLNNLSVLAPQFDASSAAGEPVQQTLLARAFAARGYHVSMIALDRGQPDRVDIGGIQVFKAYAPQAGLPVLRYVHPRLTGLWAALRRANADVYYTSCAGGIVGQVAAFCNKHGKRFVFRIASDSDCSPDTLVIKHWYWRELKLYEYGLRSAACILAQSQYQRDLIARNFAVESVVAPLIVERATADRTWAGRSIEALWVSNIRSLKRPDLLLEAARNLPQVQFHVVGGRVAGEESYYDQVEQQCARLENVTFHGPVPFGSIDELYARARVFVNTSDIEGFPNTYLQAWVHGVPVVAFFDPDSLIQCEQLGEAAGTLASMQDAIESLAKDQARWQAASRRCIEFMAQHYAEDQVLAAYVGAIDPASHVTGQLASRQVISLARAAQSASAR